MNTININIETILFATDLSKNSKMAFAYAISLAQKYDAKVKLLHVIQELSDQAVRLIGDEQWAKYRKETFTHAKVTLTGKRKDLLYARKDAEDFVNSSLKQKENVETLCDEIMVESGNPVDIITGVAERHRCDLIVMGAHNESGFISTMFGSTIIHVLKKTKIPMFIVKIDE